MLVSIYDMTLKLQVIGFWQKNIRILSNGWHCTMFSVTYVFQQCGILTSVDSYEPLQHPFKLRNSK